MAVVGEAGDSTLDRTITTACTWRNKTNGDPWRWAGPVSVRCDTATDLQQVCLVLMVQLAIKDGTALLTTALTVIMRNKTYHRTCMEAVMDTVERHTALIHTRQLNRRPGRQPRTKVTGAMEAGMVKREAALRRRPTQAMAATVAVETVHRQGGMEAMGVMAAVGAIRPHHSSMVDLPLKRHKDFGMARAIRGTATVAGSRRHRAIRRGGLAMGHPLSVAGQRLVRWDTARALLEADAVVISSRPTTGAVHMDDTEL